MFKKIEYFVFKRLFPLLLIALGLYTIFNKISFFEESNFALGIVIKMGGFLVTLLGVLFVSNETPLRGIYKFLGIIFTALFIISGVIFIKNIYNLNGINILISFIVYVITGMIMFTLFLAADKNTTTSE